MKKKRMIVVSDFHCGHEFGLTPEIYSRSQDCKEVTDIREKASRWFHKQVDRFRPYDLCLANGDLIDGNGFLTGGREQVEASLINQSTMATNILKYINAKNYEITVGSAYHTGKCEDYEAICAKDMGTELKDSTIFALNGKYFDARHFTSNASSPIGNKSIAIKKDQIFRALESYAEQIEEKKTDAPIPTVYIRSHVHKHDYSSGSNYNILLMTTPALQLNSMYGKRQCNGMVDFGFIVFDIGTKGEMTWKPIIQRIKLHSKVAQY